MPILVYQRCVNLSIIVIKRTNRHKMLCQRSSSFTFYSNTCHDVPSDYSDSKFRFTLHKMQNKTLRFIVQSNILQKYKAEWSVVSFDINSFCILRWGVRPGSVWALPLSGVITRFNQGLAVNIQIKKQIHIWCTPVLMSLISGSIYHYSRSNDTICHINLCIHLFSKEMKKTIL